MLRFESRAFSCWTSAIPLNCSLNPLPWCNYILSLQIRKLFLKEFLPSLCLCCLVWCVYMSVQVYVPVRAYMEVKENSRHLNSTSFHLDLKEGLYWTRHLPCQLDWLARWLVIGIPLSLSPGTTNTCRHAWPLCGYCLHSHIASFLLKGSSPRPNLLSILIDAFINISSANTDLHLLSFS